MRAHVTLLVGIAAAAGMFTACAGPRAGNGDTPSGQPADTPAGPTKSVRIEQITLGSGLVIEDLSLGSGEMCLPASWIRVRYTGRLVDGRPVDSSGMETRLLHLPRMIRGWQEGLVGMRVGGRRRLTVPPDLGYGSRSMKDAAGNEVIPPGSVLVYEIDLFECRTSGESP